VQLRVSGKLLWVYVISFLCIPVEQGAIFTVGFIFFQWVFDIQWAYFFQWVFDWYSGRNLCSGVSFFFYAVGGFFFFSGFSLFLYRGQPFYSGVSSLFSGRFVFFVQWIFVFVQGRIFTVGFDIFSYSGRFTSQWVYAFVQWANCYGGHFVYGRFFIWLWALKLLCAFYIAGAFD
jgi:hypothetical protein